MNSITRQTQISLGLLLSLLGAYGFILGVSFKTDANAVSIDHLESKQESRDAVIGQIATDIAVIKVKLEAIDQRLPRQAQAGRIPAGYAQ